MFSENTIKERILNKLLDSLESMGLTLKQEMKI